MGSFPGYGPPPQAQYGGFGSNPGLPAQSGYAAGHPGLPQMQHAPGPYGGQYMAYGGQGNNGAGLLDGGLHGLGGLNGPPGTMFGGETLSIARWLFLHQQF
jgi:hypothetical protein